MDQNITIETQNKKTDFAGNMISLLIALITALSVGFGFYYNTNSHLTTHDTDIKKNSDDIIVINQKVNNSERFQATTQAEINSIQDKITRIEKTQDRIEDKLDRVLERRK